MPCLDGGRNGYHMGMPTGSNRGELEAAEQRAKSRKREAIEMRKWLSEELGMPNLMNLKGNPNIERDLRNMLDPYSGNSTTHAEVAEKRADNAEYRLCRAIRVKIGVERFEEHMANYPSRNRKATRLRIWWREHKRADEAREARERAHLTRSIARARAEIAEHERALAALDAD